MVEVNGEGNELKYQWREFDSISNFEWETHKLFLGLFVLGLFSFKGSTKFCYPIKEFLPGNKYFLKHALDSFEFFNYGAGSSAWWLLMIDFKTNCFCTNSVFGKTF